MTSTTSLEARKPKQKTKKPLASETKTSQKLSNASMRALLAEWLADDSGYDEQAWPQVKAAIEENRLSERKRFAE